ncbi:hypothetical protein ACL02O_28015 [Micromonospora sp. MS34]|uniref:hypothetical protein n=1 Tax=Micromonospora sp. MS34 TaxID=3385971 RepID=UPI00399F4E6F
MTIPHELLCERRTLLSCVPSGPLLAAIDGTGPSWFGNFVVEGRVHTFSAGQRAKGARTRARPIASTAGLVGDI